MAATFEQLLLIFYLLSLPALALFGLHKYYLLHLYFKHCDEKETPPPAPAEWPAALVQLPIYNERYVIKRLLKAVVRLDYPKDRLHIQVLDDSTDATRHLTARLVRLLQKRGYRIEHLRRADRHGFKAGALAYGLTQSDVEFIAIFDADFVPQPDFLKATIPYILQPGIGMVQTRWGHINRNYSLLTKLQAIFLDGHFVIEHLARARSGKFFNFNGTAGVWRRQAINDGGGWQHDTLTEDLDLSYRAQLAGWRFCFLPDVVAPAELPVDVNAYKSQQHRWAKGSIQTGRKLLRRIWAANLPLPVKLEATVHLTNNIGYLLMLVPALLMTPVLTLQIESRLWIWVALYIFMFFAATVSVTAYYAVTIRHVLGKMWPHILHIPAMMALGIGLSINNGLATLEALLGRQSEFVRTPKFKIEKTRIDWKNKMYRSRRSYVYLAELTLALYFTIGMVEFLMRGFFMSIPFFMLFQFGFGYLASQSIASTRQSR